MRWQKSALLIAKTLQSIYKPQMINSSLVEVFVEHEVTIHPKHRKKATDLACQYLGIRSYSTQAYFSHLEVSHHA